jgi:RNA polymerase sigma-70 factor (ECF subfamily)
MPPLTPDAGTPEPFAKGDVTLLLDRWRGGDLHARDQVMDLLYPELKRLASIRMRGERSDHTIQATALVNEFFLHLAQQQGIAWNSRAHFLAVASRMMRRLLIDYARMQGADKRGGGDIRVQIDGLGLASEGDSLRVLELEELLDRLAAEDARTASVVELRCFGGLTYAEIETVIGVDERTAKRDWKFARTWLAAQLRKGDRNVGRRLGED